jgi:cytochrome c553
MFWVAGAAVSVAMAISITANVPAFSQSGDDEAQIAKSLATMLRSGRTVVSRQQDRINDPALGNKGLDGETVLAEALKIYQETTEINPLSIDAKSRHGKLIRIQMDSIIEVIDAHQQTINRQGVGFKGFIPAVFGRLVNESFGRRAVGNAEMKVTAPAALIRNAKTRPDEWESQVIGDKLLSPSWPKNQFYAAVTQSKGRAAHRTAAPEYYGGTCLTCHGAPKGEIDITGYPKEGGNEGDLGGVISITLFR